MPKNDIKPELEEAPEVILSNSPTSMTDYVKLASADDGTLLMQLVSSIPDHFVENHRTVISGHFVETFVDMLCEISDYYPKRPRKKPAKNRRKT